MNYHWTSFTEQIREISMASQRRKWQPTPVFLLGESCGQKSLVGCCPWGHTELDTTEVTQHACMHWRRKWQLTPVFLPGESQGQRSLLGCCLWGCTESDMTEATQQQQLWYLSPQLYPGLFFVFLVLLLQCSFLYQH